MILRAILLALFASLTSFAQQSFVITGHIVAFQRPWGTILPPPLLCPDCKIGAQVIATVQHSGQKAWDTQDTKTWILSRQEGNGLTVQIGGTSWSTDNGFVAGAGAYKDGWGFGNFSTQPSNVPAQHGISIDTAIYDGQHAEKIGYVTFGAEKDKLAAARFTIGGGIPGQPPPARYFLVIAVDHIADGSEPRSPECGAASLLPNGNVAHLCGDTNLPFTYNKQASSYHFFKDITRVCGLAQSPGCTVDHVFDILRRTPAAIAPVLSSVSPEQIQNCAVIPLRFCSTPNTIRIVIDPSQHSVTNYTQQGHTFYPGQVTRIVMQQNDSVMIQTISEGVGCNEAQNVLGANCKIWPDADQALKVAVWSDLHLGHPPAVIINKVCYAGITLGMAFCEVAVGK